MIFKYCSWWKWWLITIDGNRVGDYMVPSGEIYAPKRIVDNMYITRIPCIMNAFLIFKYFSWRYNRKASIYIGNYRENCAYDVLHYPCTLAKQRQGLTDEQLESRCANDRERYANMTYMQVQGIHDRQNKWNMKPEHKQKKRDQYKASRALRHNTLHKKSMAIVNPSYNPMEDSPWVFFSTII